MRRVVPAALLLGIAACGMRNVERMPAQQADMARPFTSMTNGELRSHMLEMARHTQRVTELLRHPPLTDADRAEVLAGLAALEQTAKELSADEVRTAHPALWKNIDAFRRDVSTARQQAESDPPNYFLAGTVAGACSYCHAPGHGKVH